MVEIPVGDIFTFADGYADSGLSRCYTIGDMVFLYLSVNHQNAIAANTFAVLGTMAPGWGAATNVKTSFAAGNGYVGVCNFESSRTFNVVHTYSNPISDAIDVSLVYKRSH